MCLRNTRSEAIRRYPRAYISSSGLAPTTRARGPLEASEPTLVWTGSHAIVWGGGLPPDRGYSSRGAVYDPEADRWVSLPEFGIPGRQSHAAVWTGSQMLLWGGFDSATRGDGAAYDVTPESRDPASTSPVQTKPGASP